MKIGELARATGFSTKTIRYYEEAGVLPKAHRLESGYRTYSPEDEDRLQFVRKAKRIGLSLEDIKGVLRIHDRHDPTCAHVRELLDRKLSQVDQLIADLQIFRSELRVLRDEASASPDCRPAGGRICAFIENSDFGEGRPGLRLFSEPAHRLGKESRI